VLHGLHYADLKELSENGLAENGPGIAEILKVRLIHATIRNFILHPLQDPVDASCTRGKMFESLSSFGREERAKPPMPCNQEQLTYVALTLGYVYVRSLRRLGLGLTPEHETAYLHCWSVVAHLLGVEHRLPENMNEAKEWFDYIRHSRLQRAAEAKAAAGRKQADPRPALGHALMSGLRRELVESRSRWNWKRCLRPIPGVLVRHLCSHRTANALGLAETTNFLAWLAVASIILVLRTVDFIPRRLGFKFSCGRFFTRLLGYHVMYEALMKETSPLALPNTLRGTARSMMDKPDPRASKLECKLTMKATVDVTEPAPRPDAHPPARVH
jgi:hypothetical protein